VSAEAVVPALARTTTGAQAERVLRELILDGALTPGTRLREVQLAAALGVSRNTLREALRGLAEQGLVTHHPHRGVVVTDLSAADVDDLYALRRVIELAALERVDGERIGVLREATEAFAAALERNDAVEALECDFRFHRILVGALDSARLAEAHERAQGELRLALLQLDRDYEPPAVEEHREVVAALEGADLAGAAAALTAQLERANRRLQFLVRMKESDPPAKGAAP
jgi:DNA-binding GntR family transcriptional regulator